MTLLGLSLVSWVLSASFLPIKRKAIVLFGALLSYAIPRRICKYVCDKLHASFRRLVWISGGGAEKRDVWQSQEKIEKFC